MTLKAPPFSDDEISMKAENLISEMVLVLGSKHIMQYGIGFDRIYEELIYPSYEIELDEETDLGIDEDGQRILGCYDIIGNKAYIDVSLRNDPRRTFTLWHEVGGHGILQGEWLRKQLSDKNRITTTQQSLSPETVNVLERQANFFAGHAAAPAWMVNRMINKVFKPTKRFLYNGPGGYWLDVNGQSEYYNVSDYADLCQIIAWKIQPYFGYLSKQSLGIRVSRSGWVVDKTKLDIMLYRTAASSPMHNIHRIPHSQKAYGVAVATGT